MYSPIFLNRRGKSTKKNRNPLIFRELISKIERFANTFERKNKRPKSGHPIWETIRLHQEKKMLLFFQRLDLFLRRYPQPFQAFHPAHHISRSVVKLLSCLIEGAGKAGYQIANAQEGIFESRYLII